MHDIMTNYWVPNQADLGANVNIGFGATTQIINGDVECGSGGDTAGSAARWNNFSSFLTDL